MIQAQNLCKKFGSFTAVDGVSFQIQQGEIVGFLGPNGAGKSTTMKMLTGSLKPTQGEVIIKGISMAQQPRLAKRQIGYLPESSASYKAQTVLEYLSFVGRLRGIDKSALSISLSHIMETTKLHEVAKQPIGTLSKGYRQRVGFAQALIHDPPILILDEPTDGLDPNQKHEVRTVIRSMASDKAILLSTHILEEMEALCDRVILINQGKIVLNVTPYDLLKRSKYHGAVEFHLDSSLSDAQVADLRKLNGVASCEYQGENQYILLAQTGAKLLSPVHQSLTHWGIEPQELFTHKGNLDEVFRDLTQGEAV